MKFSRSNADIFTPDGSDPAEALARVTHLCVVAHQDNIEIMSQAGIVECRGSTDNFFGGVVVTDGAGSPRSGRYENFSDAQMRAVRREEQRRAAVLGGYAIQIQLDHPSADVKKSTSTVCADLGKIFFSCAPQVVYLHNPADTHDTHVAVLLRCFDVLRALPPGRRPRRVLGCEVMRSLDWLVDTDKVVLDAGGEPGLAAEMLKVFDSQIAGGKHYDVATLGRRAANATFHTSHATDKFEAITWAMDLTPLVQADKLDVAALTLAHIDRMRADVAARLERLA